MPYAHGLMSLTITICPSLGTLVISGRPGEQRHRCSRQGKETSARFAMSKNRPLWGKPFGLSFYSMVALIVQLKFSIRHLDPMSHFTPVSSNCLTSRL